MILDFNRTEAQLRKERSRLLADIRDRLHASGDPDKLALLNRLESVGDWVEASVFADNDMALLHRELDHLAEIDAALARIKVGIYGICTECGETIAAGRLEAQPTAQHCISCQQEAESRAAAVRV
jgi:DnaK suppressor protein